MSMSAHRFDAGYYERYYESPRTRVQGPAEVARIADLVIRVVSFAGGRVKSVLDVGAGTGLWRGWFEEHHPDVRYRTVDVSPYACERYRHELRDISRWRTRARFDLVVCQGVLPYLAAPAAERAIENMTAMCAGFMYIEATTRDDLATICDTELTDVSVHRRSGAWYRRRISRELVSIGLGLWMRRDLPHRLYELEHSA
jgi:SAM-dependent methyltransferase